MCDLIRNLNFNLFKSRGEPRLELSVHMCISLELFWNSLNNAPSSIVFYLEMKVEVEVCTLGRGSPLALSIRLIFKNNYFALKLCERRNKVVIFG